jgi:hypothetical protein
VAHVAANQRQVGEGLRKAHSFPRPIPDSFHDKCLQIGLSVNFLDTMRSARGDSA